MLRIFSFSIICVSVFVITAFFMPWVSGRGSILEPLDDSTKFIQKIEITGTFKGAVEIAKKTADALTYVFTHKRLNKTIKGFQIPLLMAKSMGIRVYMLYGVPIAATLFCFLTLAGNRWRRFDIIVVLLALGIFFMLYRQERLFNQEKLFINIQARWGFITTVYSFLAISCLSLLKLTISRKAYRFKKRRQPKMHKK
ncbi:MAG: hypothetical protein NG737_00940 [Omnitrophica bacterium]|nr:hypothetical protein [Candidatus Omnitrophota bacterium]